jgi:hypothetical protein
LNLRPSGYEPDELPGCSTPRYLPGLVGRAGSSVAGAARAPFRRLWPGMSVRVPAVAALPVWAAGLGCRSGLPDRFGEERERVHGLAATYSPASWDAVPSARRGLTAGFGMGPGVSLALWPPDLCSPLIAMKLAGGWRGRMLGARRQGAGVAHRRSLAWSRRSFLCTVRRLSGGEIGSRP